MTHVRACPKCGVIVEWSKGEPEPTTMLNGKVIMSRPCWLECPEHGKFDNISKKMNEGWERVERGMKKKNQKE